jgi:dihydrofolate reductase
MITIIVARAKDGAIGQNGKIPWSIPDDLRAFQRETLGGALIMGRNTWLSLPVRPLSKRMNIVVSASQDIAPIVASSVKVAIKIAMDHGYQRIYGIGGARIYQEMLPLADRLLISEVDALIPNADTFFPDVDLGHWRMDHERPLQLADPKCYLREYIKRQ